MYGTNHCGPQLKCIQCKKKKAARHKARDKSSSFPVLTVRLLPRLGKINGPERYFSHPICCHQSFRMLFVTFKNNLSLFFFQVSLFYPAKGKGKKFGHTEWDWRVQWVRVKYKSNYYSNEDVNPALVMTMASGRAVKLDDQMHLIWDRTSKNIKELDQISVSTWKIQH